jgi:hypothetical protein
MVVEVSRIGPLLDLVARAGGLLVALLAFDTPRLGGRRLVGADAARGVVLPRAGAAPAPASGHAAVGLPGCMLAGPVPPERPLRRGAAGTAPPAGPRLRQAGV